MGKAPGRRFLSVFAEFAMSPVLKAAGRALLKTLSATQRRLLGKFYVLVGLFSRDSFQGCSQEGN
jgi:hypothetical protein